MSDNKNEYVEVRKEDNDVASCENCEPCETEGVLRSAIFFCNQCQENYCPDCKYQHGRFKRLVYHDVNELSSPDYDEMTTERHFEVVVQETESSKKRNVHGQHGRHELHVNPEGVTLVDIRRRHELFAWGFAHIRNYGIKNGKLSIEVGRLSQTGEGLWQFTSQEQKAILESVKENTAVFSTRLKKKKT